MTRTFTAAEAKRLLQETPFTRDFHFSLHILADGVCVLDVPFQEKFERPDGLGNG